MIEDSCFDVSSCIATANNVVLLCLGLVVSGYFINCQSPEVSSIEQTDCTHGSKLLKHALNCDRFLYINRAGVIQGPLFKWAEYS